MDSSDFVEAPLNPNLNDLLEAPKHQNSSGFFEVLNSYTTWPAVLAAVLMFFAYYFLWIVKRPILVGNTHLLSFIRDYCPSLTEKYWPTFWCFEARTQTILGATLKRAARIRYSRETLTLSDGGVIGLDWCYNDENSSFSEQLRPTVLILPGIVGDSDANYARNFIKILAKLGYRSVVFNYRGNGGVTLKTPQTYCAAKVGDLEYVIDHVHTKYPNAPFMATGISMGGLKLINYLAIHGTDTPLLAGMIISAPYEVFESSNQLEQPLNSFLFNRMLTKLMVNRLKNYEDFFRSETELDIDSALKSRTIRQFDSSFTAKLFGYDSYQEYYNDANIHLKLHQVKIPVLALNAADDPFSPKRAIPLKEAGESSSVVIAVTPYGGHIGFLDGIFPRYQTYMDRVFKEYVQAVFNNTDSMKNDGSDMNVTDTQ